MRGILVSGAALALATVPVAAQQKPETVYFVKPPEIAIPDGVPVGEYRRVIRPFKNWTLICDENLKAKKRVCNVTQTIVDQTGETAFSWSLAGTDGGAPVMIMRVPAVVGKDKPITLSFNDGDKPITATTNGCNAQVCVAVQQIGPRLKGYIAKGAVTQITYPKPMTGPEGSRTMIIGLFAPLEGLSKAVSSI